MYFLSFYRIIFRHKFSRDVIYWKYFKCMYYCWRKYNKTPRFCELERSALSFRKKYCTLDQREERCFGDPSTWEPATFRPTPSVLPTIRPLWKWVPVILLYLYDLSWYFSSTPGLWWTYCHTEHDVHRVLPALWLDIQPAMKQNLYVLSHLRHLNN
jgi:hypothetical protein